MKFIKHMFAIGALSTAAIYGSTDTAISSEDSTIPKTRILSVEDKGLLKKLALPLSDPYYGKPVTESIAILTESEKHQLIMLADNGSVEAQQYLWIAYTQGMYGFSKNESLAIQLKARYKTENLQRKKAKVSSTKMLQLE